MSLTPLTAWCQLDDRGFVQLTGLSTGFEESSGLPFVVAVVGRGGPRFVDSREQSLAQPLDLPLEGEAALAIEADGILQVYVPFGDALQGRRVRVDFWQKTQGARARGTLVWWSGGVEQALRSGNTGGLFTTGALVFAPTEDETTDGWRRWTSGPVDASLGGALQPVLLLAPEPNLVAASDGRRVWVDAVQVVDLGPAVHEPAACRPSLQPCDGGAACRFGRCVDPAVTEGPNFATDEHRSQYIRRRAFEWSTFLGHRGARSRSQATAAAFETLNAGEERFWPRLGDLIDRTEDGHAKRPITTGSSNLAAGFCLVLGQPDLLPRTGLLPLVSRVATGHPSDLRPGDVLVAIDGSPVEAWMQRYDAELPFSGDRRVQRVAETQLLPSRLAQRGAVLTFSRCENVDGCALGEEQTIEVDFGSLSGSLWTDQVPSWRSLQPICDGRFERIEADDLAAMGHVASSTSSDFTLLQFNATLGDSFGDYTQWRNEIDRALASGPDRVILDSRRGDGGSFQGLHYLTSFFFESGREPVTAIFPWLFDRRDDPLLTAELTDCASSGLSGVFGCGGALWVTRAEVAPEAPASGVLRSSRVALLTGLDVSGNDWFADHVRRRRPATDGTTRVFGPAPTYGAFGEVVDLPLWSMGYAPPSLQITGGLVAFGPADPLDDFLDGRGVEPDAVVHQKQSDALLGLDTQKMEAIKWLTAE